MDLTVSALHPPAYATSPTLTNTLFEDLNAIYQRCEEKEQPLESMELDELRAYTTRLLPKLGGEDLSKLIPSLDEYDCCCLGFALTDVMRL